MPDLSGKEALQYERYFLERGNGVEVRITKVGEKYFYEKKVELSDLERTKEKKEISQAEFDELKQKASDAIIREKFLISTNPEITLAIYHGRFEGLVRVEVEFETEEEAKVFVPLAWMGEEMTSLPIARDSKLLDLSDEEFRKYLR